MTNLQQPLMAHANRLRSAALPLMTVAGLALASSAQASHPLVTETATHLARGVCEVDFAQAKETQRAQADNSASDVNFSCSAGARSQYMIGLSSNRANGLRTERYNLEGKTTVWPAEEGETAWGLRYAVDWAVATGQSTRLDKASMQVLASRALSKDVLGHANLGFVRHRQAGKSASLWSVGVETLGRWQFAADLYGEGSNKSWASAGVGWHAFSDMVFSISAAQQLNDSSARALKVGLRLVY